MPPSVVQTTCCVVGGGPAGVMLGYLLARQGVSVTVLEKHQDFFRDFRGDTVHPSTLEVLHELGLLEEFLKLPHQQIQSLGLVLGDTTFPVADFSHVPTHCKFIALMPQWDFLNFLTTHAKKFPTFQLLLEHEMVDLCRDNHRITGVLAHNNDQHVEIRSDLVIGCDGRHSVTRRAAGLEVIEHGVPIDVLWFRISRNAGDPAQVLGNINYGRALILIDRADYFQAGLIIAKGSYDTLRARGLDAFRADLLQIAPWLGDRVHELKDWDQVKILTVQINRLRRWHLPGLLCIGDAAHAMSPAGGVGINLAIQDAVATANLLAQPLLQNRLREFHLAAVQRRRTLPTRITQGVQLVAHRGMAKIFQNPGPIHAPWQFHAVQHIPRIHRALGYAVGIGALPEHVRPLPTPKNPRREHAGSALPALVCAGIGVAAAAAVCGWAAWKLFRRFAVSPMYSG
ncbi:MAG TPA: FAD-dependent oxidoreductase [Terracidiphilus sp.]|jgi:2-polyprenyl-6-methoxyphenol hydroxylase-like FAD-dependent oxidoreductase|nr:FAD-dependent oxidoreductase [Terracidiphilus sp.]